MAATVTDTLGDLVVAPDMSGSTWGMRDAFFSELIAVAQDLVPSRVHVLCWDTEVASPHQSYYPDEYDHMEATLTPAGGGGTVVECVPKYISDENIDAEAAIIFTDGYLYGGYGDFTSPVLWCVCDNKSFNPPNGIVVHIDSSRDL